MSGGFQKVFVRDYRLRLRIGVYPHEQEREQALVVNVALWLKPQRRERDELEAVLDYTWMAEVIEAQAKAEPVKLLETFAERLVEVFFSDERVEGVELHLEKPEVSALCKSMGYELLRMRDG